MSFYLYINLHLLQLGGPVAIARIALEERLTRKKNTALKLVHELFLLREPDSEALLLLHPSGFHLPFICIFIRSFVVSRPFLLSCRSHVNMAPMHGTEAKLQIYHMREVYNSIFSLQPAFLTNALLTVNVDCRDGSSIYAISAIF
jgi:hypothetical protein